MLKVMEHLYYFLFTSEPPTVWIDRAKIEYNFFKREQGEETAPTKANYDFEKTLFLFDISFFLYSRKDEL